MPVLIHTHKFSNFTLTKPYKLACKLHITKHLFVYHILFLSLLSAAALNAKLHIASCSPPISLTTNFMYVFMPCCIFFTRIAL